MKQWTFEVSQNGWEYSGAVFITANEVEQIDSYTVVADGVTIAFDEEITPPEI